MKKIGLGLLLVLMPCFLWAESKLIDGRWYQAPDNPALFIDFKTAKDGSIWVKHMIPNNEKSQNYNAHYVLVRSDALCSSNKIRIAELIWFNRKNRLIKRLETSSDYKVIVPNTLQESLFELACEA